MQLETSKLAVHPTYLLLQLIQGFYMILVYTMFSGFHISQKSRTPCTCFGSINLTLDKLYQEKLGYLALLRNCANSSTGYNWILFGFLWCFTASSPQLSFLINSWRSLTPWCVLLCNSRIPVQSRIQDFLRCPVLI